MAKEEADPESCPLRAVVYTAPAGQFLCSDIWLAHLGPILGCGKRPYLEDFARFEPDYKRLMSSLQRLSQVYNSRGQSFSIAVVASCSRAIAQLPCVVIKWR